MVAATLPRSAIPISASIPNVTSCNPTQNPHTYGNAGIIGDSHDGQPDAQAGADQSFDGCKSSNSVTHSPGDGDPETGVGGALFPAGDCVEAPAVAHHAYAPGSAYYITNALPLISAALSVGTDGGSFDGSCGDGNGIVSNDPATDPFDCGSGVVGLSTPMIGANIVPNVPGLSCTPAGGFVAAFTQTGPILVDNGHCDPPSVRLGILDADGNLLVPPSPSVASMGDQSGCTTLTLQTVTVSFQGFIGDAGV